MIIIGTNYWELSEIIVQENNAACGENYNYSIHEKFVVNS